MTYLELDSKKPARFRPSRAHRKLVPLGLLVCLFGYSAVPARASLWSSSAVPGTPDVDNDSAAVTLGITFYSDVPGSVTGVRFYKGTSNIGPHVGALYSNTGTQLASVTFSEETESGWQQANFPAPVGISAHTPYVISYITEVGNYANDQNYEWSSVNAAPLHVWGSSPGVFAYGPNISFPTGTWNSSNYWVDVVFRPDTPGPPPASGYTISGHVSGAPATLTLSGAASGTAKTDGSGNFNFPGLANGGYLIAPSQSGFAFTPATAAVTVNHANVSGLAFTAVKNETHSVTLSWTPSVSPNITGYKVYRSGVSGGPYGFLIGPVSGPSYVDKNVAAGQKYFYVTTAVNSSGVESGYSAQAEAVVPAP